MTIRSALCSALALALLAMPQTALAQAAETPAVEGAANGEPYLVATHRDWEIVCSMLSPEGPEVCEMYQLLVDDQQTPIAEITIAALPDGLEFAAGATITTPLETFLPTGLGWRVGEAEQMRIEGFRVCTVIGCVARMGLSGDEVEAMKRGAFATITIAPFVAIDEPVDIRVSLLGFTAAMDDLRGRLPAPAATE